MNQKTKEIAEFDGWKIIPEGTYAECHRQTIWFGHGGSFNCYHDITPLSDLPYLTDLNALHRVIKKIRYEFHDKIEPKEDAVNAYKRLGDAIYNAFDSDSFTDLHDAVYDAIVYLKQHDSCQPIP